MAVAPRPIAAHQSARGNAQPCSAKISCQDAKSGVSVSRMTPSKSKIRASITSGISYSESTGVQVFGYSDTQACSCFLADEVHRGSTLSVPDASEMEFHPSAARRPFTFLAVDIDNEAVSPLPIHI